MINLHDFFKFSGELSAGCSICQNTYKFTAKSKSNLYAHLDSVHKEDIEKYLSDKKSQNPFKLSTLLKDDQAKISEAVVEFII